MATKLSFRTGERLPLALVERARNEGKTASELVRAILADAVLERSVLERTRHVVGQLDFEVDDDEWRQRIQERNWRR